MTTIPLDRRFFEWRDDGHSDPDSFRRWMRSSHLLSWDDVVARRRVVLLAEAGSGKTEEMREQARLRSAASQFAVYATVEDVGREGLEQALGASDRARLAAWRNTDDKGWFFVDSVDEARLGQVRFDRALRQIANGIFGTERRAHIVLSCRATDWGAARDLERLTEVLPIPRDAPAPPSSPDQLLVRVLHAKKPEAATVSVEAPLVVLMEPLDRERTECFCAAKCVPDLGSFVEEIEARNLWQFARRPLDLDWLIDFWREHRRLGSLAEMLETSLSARVLEPNPDRARADDLDPARALRALERIGGALVLGRRRTIATLDSDLLRSDDDRPLDLPQVLTDWTPQDCIRLLNRPVFDPATYGRARLHNDNENVVRAYLAARWLHRLRTENLSKGELFGLLFATSYGVVLVKPSMQETAAWLALWDEDVGREVARRMPELLMTAGDPASLPAPVREAAFSDVLARITTGTCRLPPFAEDSLKRFAQPDLGAALRRLWPLYKHDAEARRVMLQLIWLGALSDCANLAAEVAFDKDAEEYGRATAGRAIITAGDDGLKRRYADFVVENCGALPLMVVTDALDGLFPTRIGVGDLLKILGEIDVGHSQGASSVEREAPGWFDRLNDRAEIERLLAGLLMQLGPESADVGRIPDAREEAYLSGIAAAASRLLQFCNPDELPGDTVEAALRVGRADRYGHSTLHERRDIAPELQRTIKRRHLAFWRIVERRKGRDWLGGRPIEHIDQMALFGYAPHLGEEDLDWLLADVKTRTIESERRLAIATALGVWRDAGTRAKAILARIREVASGDAMLTAIVQYWLHPPKPSPAYRAQERRYKALHKKHEAERAERDRSWVEFVERLRKNPGELRALAPPTPQGADSRLYHLWMFLCDAMDTNGRSAIDSIAPVEPMLGSEVAIEVRDALIRFWREWTPTSKSQRASGQRNSYSALDCMGITGVSLEAATRPRWAQHLSHAEARQAAVYGTIELSGFPAWFEALGDAQPTAVREVLSCELLAELADPEPRVRYDVFEDTARAGAGTTALVAPDLFATLKRREDIPVHALAPMLQIIGKGLSTERADFLSLALERFRATEIEVAALYLGTAFGVDADRATDALSERLTSLEARVQTELAQALLPSIFGFRFGHPEAQTVPLPFATLERLVNIAFGAIRPAEDRHRGSGVFTPNNRDNAEQARGAALNQLANTPGWATFAALHRLAENPNLPGYREHLHELARSRAAQDAECPPWPPGEVAAFEGAAEAAPRTPADLQRTALRRLDDLQLDLLHGDFAQGPTLKALPDETAVQNWIADRLRSEQGRAYSVEREPHVVEEKEPDVRLRAKATDASVAVEIKVAESWTLRQLEKALTDQLCGRYLRAPGACHGILLLVHQHARPQGWRLPGTKTVLRFDEVVAHLRRLTVEIASASPDAPQPEIAVLDVSSC